MTSKWMIDKSVCTLPGDWHVALAKSEVVRTLSVDFERRLGRGARHSTPSSLHAGRAGASGGAGWLAASLAGSVPLGPFSVSCPEPFTVRNHTTLTSDRPYYPPPITGKQHRLPTNVAPPPAERVSWTTRWGQVGPSSISGSPRLLSPRASPLLPLEAPPGLPRQLVALRR